MITNYFLLIILFIPIVLSAHLKVGVGQKNIHLNSRLTTQGGTNRIHDPLLATAMVIDNGEKLVAFCSVDHIGFLHEMTEEVKRQVQNLRSLAKCEVFIGASHTHAGGGGYVNFPNLEELILGPKDTQLTKTYVDSVVNAIIQASKNLQPAKIGIGYGKVKELTTYNKEFAPPTDLTIIKATKLDNSPLAIFFNCSLHPDLLVYTSKEIPPPNTTDTMLMFSADVVGYARNHIKSLIGHDVTPIFFNGPKGGLKAKVPFPNDRFKSCDVIGKQLAKEVFNLWNETEVKDKIAISTFKHRYVFEPKPTASRFLLSIKKYQTEINLIVFDLVNAFLTTPAKLSYSYDSTFKSYAKKIGFKQLSILDLVNDAHGYVNSKDQAERSEFSLGGEMYGQIMENKVCTLLEDALPNKS